MRTTTKRLYSEHTRYDDIHNGMASLDGGNVVLDFVDSDGPGGSGAMTLSKRYLWGEQVDELLAEEDVTKSLTATDRVLWPVVDHLGTVRDLVKQDGTVATHFVYTAFGGIVSGDTSLTRYLFTSCEFDTDTDLQYNRARWYDAQTGRWISEDSLGFAAGDVNTARSVGNGVVDHIDADGLQKGPRPTTANTLQDVPVYTDGMAAGTRSKPWGDGKHINIGGEKENAKFDDYDIRPGHPPSFIRGYERPFTSELPDHSVSHFVIRSTPVTPEIWKEIVRLKTEKAVVTIAGPPKYVLAVYNDMRSQKVIGSWLLISSPAGIQRVRIPARTGPGPDGRRANYPPLEGMAFSVLLGPETRLPTSK